MQEYATIQIALGVGVVVLSLLFLLKGDHTKFQWLFLLGLMGLAGGLMASRLINFWMGIGLFVLWFVVAGLFYFQGKKRDRES